MKVIEIHSYPTFNSKVYVSHPWHGSPVPQFIPDGSRGITSVVILENDKGAREELVLTASLIDELRGKLTQEEIFFLEKYLKVGSSEG